MKSCIFCKIIRNELPCSKVYEDKDFLAFMDTQPVNTGHVLVIPKAHTELIVDLERRLVKNLLSVGAKISKAIRGSYIKPAGINFFLADGEAAGQEVFHVHLHVIPRFAKDGFGFKFPPGYRNRPQRALLNKAAAGIRMKLR